VALLYPPVVPGPEPYVAALPVLQEAAAQARSGTEPLRLTGTTLLEESTTSDRGIAFEIALGAGGALVVLVLVFASLLAALPLLVAAVSILATFLALLGLTELTDVSFVVQYLVALIGLGVAIDYSLIIVTRWREERAHGADNDTAVRTAMATAGRSVVFSGITVAVSLAALVAVPLPFLRSIGLGGLLIPLLSVATSTTLVPAVLHAVGPGLEWPRRCRPRDPVSPGWARLARWVVAHRWAVIVATVVALLAMAAPVLGLHLGAPQTQAYGTTSNPGRAAADITGSGLPAGLLRPVEVLSPTRITTDLGAQLAGVPGVAATIQVRDPAWTREPTTLALVVTRPDPASDAGSAVVEQVRDVAQAAGAASGGTAAEDADFVTAVYQDAPLVLGVIVLLTFVLLARALRSVWLPVKALVLNVLSIGAAYGLTVLVWQHGLGTQTLFASTSSGAITIWVPVAVFAFLFGLSIDYEVFILSRMRESYDAHRDTTRAVVEGISHTGRLVTSAALILFLAFIALSTVPSIDVKILATGLAFGIAIDALLVRSLLAPALVAALGTLNWTMPAHLARALRLPGDDPGADGR